MSLHVLACVALCALQITPEMCGHTWIYGVCAWTSDCICICIHCNACNRAPVLSFGPMDPFVWSRSLLDAWATMDQWACFAVGAVWVRNPGLGDCRAVATSHGRTDLATECKQGHAIQHIRDIDAPCDQLVTNMKQQHQVWTNLQPPPTCAAASLPNDSAHHQTTLLFWYHSFGAHRFSGSVHNKWDSIVCIAISRVHRWIGSDTVYLRDGDTALSALDDCVMCNTAAAEN